MRSLRVALAIAAALFAQTMLSPLLGRTSVVVDLGLVVVVFTGLLMGPVAGLLAGTVTGLMQDALAGGIVGLSGLSKTLVGFGSGAFGTMFIVARPAPRYVVFFLASLADSAMLVGFHAVLDARSFPPAFATIVARALLNAAVGVMVFLAIEFWPRFMERRKIGKGKMGPGRIERGL
jgi:rod shape-determining protein MreD